MRLLRREPGNENKSSKGGYVLQEAEGGERKLTILSTGSELYLAVEARDILQKQGIPTAVVSMPCRLHDEKRGSDECGDQPQAVADAVRDFFALRLLAPGACGQIDNSQAG